MSTERRLHPPRASTVGSPVIVVIVAPGGCGGVIPDYRTPPSFFPPSLRFATYYREIAHLGHLLFSFLSTLLRERVHMWAMRGKKNVSETNGPCTRVTALPMDSACVRYQQRRCLYIATPDQLLDHSAVSRGPYLLITESGTIYFRFKRRTSCITRVQNAVVDAREKLFFKQDPFYIFIYSILYFYHSFCINFIATSATCPLYENSIQETFSWQARSLEVHKAFRSLSTKRERERRQTTQWHSRFSLVGTRVFSYCWFDCSDIRPNWR